MIRLRVIATATATLLVLSGCSNLMGGPVTNVSNPATTPPTSSAVTASCSITNIPAASQRGDPIYGIVTFKSEAGPGFTTRPRLAIGQLVGNQGLGGEDPLPSDITVASGGATTYDLPPYDTLAIPNVTWVKWTITSDDPAFECWAGTTFG